MGKTRAGRTEVAAAMAMEAYFRPFKIDLCHRDMAAKRRPNF
jgi:hypothetical protein